MMALMINMTTSLSSSSEYRRLTDHCGSLPPLDRLDDRNDA